MRSLLIVLVMQATKINWKDPENSLTKLHPRVEEDEEESDMPAEAGSFFNFFEIASDPFDVGLAVRRMCNEGY
jgi:template-activating factor I